jgi:predicted enzyme related to lactoylglutathione lyase
MIHTACRKPPTGEHFCGLFSILLYLEHMNNITGIGGFMFRSENPEALKRWYIEVLGIDIQNMVWQQQAGPTVFEPVVSTSDYFVTDQLWMINFRVTDLQTLILGLKSKGVEVEERAEWNSMPEVGTFARIHDPEGNPIELWQPATL